MKILSRKEEDTKLFSKKALESQAKKKDSATVICLRGLLGSGKTTFVKGLAEHLGIKEKVTSPTFLIIKKYKINSDEVDYKALFHIDAYRIDSEKDMESLNIKEIFNNPENLVLIEWPEKIKNLIPKSSLFVSLKHGDKENEREIVFN